MIDIHNFVRLLSKLNTFEHFLTHWNTCSKRVHNVPSRSTNLRNKKKYLVEKVKTSL